MFSTGPFYLMTRGPFRTVRAPMVDDLLHRVEVLEQVSCEHLTGKPDLIRVHHTGRCPRGHLCPLSAELSPRRRGRRWTHPGCGTHGRRGRGCGGGRRPRSSIPRAGTSIASPRKDAVTSDPPRSPRTERTHPAPQEIRKTPMARGDWAPSAGEGGEHSP